MSYATKEQLESLMADIASKVHIPTIGVGGGYAPIGTIIAYMGTTAPQDYLACDGSVHNIADYPQLADFIESQFGSKNYFGGDGTTTFAVPDLRGEFLRGTGTNSHTNQGNGSAVGVHQDSTEIPIISSNTAGTQIIARKLNKTDGNGIKNADVGLNYSTNALTASGTWTTSLSSSYERCTVRPTNTSVLYCIKAVVAGEVYSTDERVVGTWIDGKPIYQKTIDFGTLPNATTKSINHNIINIDFVINCFGIAYNPSNTNYMILPKVAVNNITNGVDIGANATQITIITGTDRSPYSKTYITLQYTKTTD